MDFGSGLKPDPSLVTADIDEFIPSLIPLRILTFSFLVSLIIPWEVGSRLLSNILALTDFIGLLGAKPTQEEICSSASASRGIMVTSLKVFLADGRR